MDTKTLSNLTTYKGMAMITTDINFYKKNNEIVTVNRRYQDNIFMDTDEVYLYKYPFYQTNTNVSTSTVDNKTISNTITREASPSENEMHINGYVFLGWISSLEVPKNGDIWNYIYDVQNDSYCTSNISKVEPYLLDNNELVYETLDVYPVYAKWNITTTTNVRSFGGLYNTPSNPTYNIVESTTENGKGIVTITPDETTYIMGNEGEIYDLLELVRVYEDGTEEKIDINNNTYQYSIEAGKQYVFMAKYRPYTVVYHLNVGETNIIIRNHLDVLGQMPSPTYNIENSAVFIGWTDENPNNGKYHCFQTYDDFENADMSMYTENTIVYNALELWPVYIELQLTVNSNIDNILTQNSINLDEIRYISRPSVSQTQLNAVASILGNYVFDGWYKNYQNSANKGELVSHNTTYVLEDTESVTQNVFTAVYRKIEYINYFNAAGELIYSAEVDEYLERTFVTQSLDNEGNTIEVPIDSEAYDEISNSLGEDEIFINWKWQKQDGTMVSWEDFYDKNVTSSMNIYPIIRKIQATNPNGEGVSIIVGKDDSEVDICFKTEYIYPYILVNVIDISYDSNGINSSHNVANIPVSIYKDQNSMESYISNGTTDELGNSTLYLFGDIIVTQNGESNINDVFIYQIINDNDNVINEFSLSIGESKTVRIPYGEFSIIRKNNWAWRYLQNTNEVFTMSNVETGQELFIEGNRITNKWFDSCTHIDNKYE